MLNPDGTATCDRCHLDAPGYGVIHGMVCQSLQPSGIIDNLLVCYGCRPPVLAGLVNYPGVPDRCTHCGIYAPARTVNYGILVTDLAPASDGAIRYMLFGDDPNSSRALFLSRLAL